MFGTSLMPGVLTIHIQDIVCTIHVMQTQLYTHNSCTQSLSLTIASHNHSHHTAMILVHVVKVITETLILSQTLYIVACNKKITQCGTCSIAS